VDNISLEDLAIDPAEDPGTNWHPTKAEALNGDGNLRDLSDDEVHEHIEKPESDEQIDGVRRRRRERRAELAAEDSLETPDGEI
jgi:hypothetical protein